MKPSLWGLFIVIVLLLNIVQISGESYIKRLNLKEGRRGSLFRSTQRNSNFEAVPCDNSEIGTKNTSKCDARTTEQTSFVDTMARTPYMTLALKVLLMVILCYTL
ncbi:uncharacterized protein LOC126568732 [Anopheles maculipalpis]|uniref:uncharacterized protein LOC126568732 n=1 Tax=Anopheles maculipalpis TaxID=1496333 RepID=UPI00215912DA|nr:uncharacterized protein LOC126568732 [Anopheles maculipalpis]